MYFIYRFGFWIWLYTVLLDKFKVKVVENASNVLNSKFWVAQQLKDHLCVDCIKNYRSIVHFEVNCQLDTKNWRNNTKVSKLPTRSHNLEVGSICAINLSLLGTINFKYLYNFFFLWILIMYRNSTYTKTMDEPTSFFTIPVTVSVAV